MSKNGKICSLVVHFLTSKLTEKLVHWHDFCNVHIDSIPFLLATNSPWPHMICSITAALCNLGCCEISSLFTTVATRFWNKQRKHELVVGWLYCWYYHPTVVDQKLIFGLMTLWLQVHLNKVNPHALAMEIKGENQQSMSVGSSSVAEKDMDDNEFDAILADLITQHLPIFILHQNWKHGPNTTLSSHLSCCFYLLESCRGAGYLSFLIILPFLDVVS